MGTMAQKKLGDGTHNDHYLCAPITHHVVTAANYEMKPHSLNLVQLNQFEGSTNEDAGMHLKTFTEICAMMRIKDVEQDVNKLRLFPFSLRGNIKNWLLALPKGTTTSWEECINTIMSKFFPSTKTMKLRSNIISFRQEEHEPLALEGICYNMFQPCD
jgi:hypothetical protein